MKKFFTAGLLLWLPIAITLWLLEKLVRWGDKLMTLLPHEFQPSVLLGIDFPGMGLLFGLLVVFLTGVFVANFLGQKIVDLWERLVDTIPLVRTIYQGVKQIAGTFLSTQSQSFKEVVVLEFPREGAWTFGFVVGEPSPLIAKEIHDDAMVTVYIPTAPNPTSGYAVMMPRSQLIKTHATVEEALKFHVSLGLMGPKGTPPVPEGATPTTMKDVAASDAQKATLDLPEK